MKTFLKAVYRRLRALAKESGLWLVIFRALNHGKEKFLCPLCGYRGPFRDLLRETGFRRHAWCPRCNSLERHRLQFLVMKKLEGEHEFSTMDMLHFAPESFFRGVFKNRFKSYTTADLAAEGVDCRADMTELPFDDRSFDFIFASHVLEHIKDDEKALSEISRVLKPGGVAVLPVPLVAEKTVEYPGPNPHDSSHVRAPGPDYFEKYKKFFRQVEEMGSEDFPPVHQLYYWEDRTGWPTEAVPMRPAMKGERHRDVIPVCLK